MLEYFKNFLHKEKEVNQKAEPTPLKEGLDFYIENGLYVFTAHYLKNRGYCCGSGCRHCPYNKKDK